MQKQTRRQILKGTAVTAAALAGGAATTAKEADAQSQSSPTWVKKAVRRAPSAPAPGAAAPAQPAGPAQPPMFNGIITFGNLVFIAGIGAHFKGTIEEHTKHVIDEIEKNLILAGSSMDKVLKVNVYLASLDDYDKMNSVYRGRWGSTPPVRTTVAVSGVPGNSLVEIDCIASL